MRSVAIVTLTLIAFSSIGCKSKQDQLAEVYAQLDTMNTQYQMRTVFSLRSMSLPAVRQSAKRSVKLWSPPARSSPHFRPM